MTKTEREPEIAKRGKLIEVSNPQPEIRKNAESASDWEFKEEAAYLYEKAVLLKDRLLDPVLLTDRGRLPDPVISFDNLRNNKTLAAYSLVRNPQGLLYEITFNSTHYIDDEEGKKVWRFGRWAQLETLAHEQVHLKQQNFGKDPVIVGKRRTYHNKEFVDMCEAIGLHPKLAEGYHTKLADGPFAVLMKELGVAPPAELPKLPPELDIDWFRWFLKELGKEKKGTSTLSKWVCPECDLKVRIGIKGNPEIVHDPCSQKKGEKVFFVRADDQVHNIYVAPSEKPKSD